MAVVVRRILGLFRRSPAESKLDSRGTTSASRDGRTRRMAFALYTCFGRTQYRQTDSNT